MSVRHRLSSVGTFIEKQVKGRVFEALENSKPHTLSEKHHVGKLGRTKHHVGPGVATGQHKYLTQGYAVACNHRYTRRSGVDRSRREILTTEGTPSPRI